LLELPAFSKRYLWDLVDQTSICALRLLKIDTNLVLSTCPGEWPESPTFEAYRQSMVALKVTNDGAERGKALVTGSNSHLKFTSFHPLTLARKIDGPTTTSVDLQVKAKKCRVSI
jgi:hypothetical protein